MTFKKNIGQIKKTITSAGKDVQKLEVLYIPGGIVQMVWPFWKTA